MITKFFDIIISIIEGTLRAGVEILESVLTNSKNKSYTAEFSSSWSLLSPWNKGFCLTGDKNLTLKLSYQNALVIASTGLGKTTTILLPTLYSLKNSSVIVNDPSGENYLKSSGYLKEQGFIVKQLNFSKPDASSGFNPLLRANTSSEINKVSSMLISNALGKNAKDPFWNNSAIQLLSMLISILKKQEPQYQNLYTVRMLLNKMGASPEQVDKLFSQYADENLWDEYKSFLSADDKVISGTISTVKAALQIFSDESVAKITSTDNIDMQQFRDKPTVLFIQNSVADQKYFSTLTSIFFEQFFSFVLSRFPKEEEQNIFFLIDEASSLNMPTLQLAVSNVRKHRAGILILYQTYDQCVHQYGKHEAEAIRSNCYVKMFFAGQNLETSRELEQILGRYEYRDKDDKKIIRELMTASEVRMLKENKAIIIAGNRPPILAKLKPFYKNFRYSRLSQIPAPRTISQTCFDSVPVLPLPAIEKVHE